MTTKAKITYCKYCGGEINQNKKCTKCGKQYFTLRNKKTLSALLIIAIVCAFYYGAKFYILQQDYVSLKNKYNHLETCYFELIDTIELEPDASENTPSGYYVISDSSYYHSHDCFNIARALKPIYYYNSEFECISKGYQKCHECLKDQPE